MATITTLTAEDVAAELDGSEYRNEGSRQLWGRMKEAGLVAVFGASDDLVEVRGAADDELGAYNGTTLYFTPTGLLENDCDNDDCPHFRRAQRKAAAVEVAWSENGYSWFVTAPFAHKTFSVNEDGEPYCRGIVFSLSDVAPALATAARQG